MNLYRGNSYESILKWFQHFLCMLLKAYLASKLPHTKKKKKSLVLQNVNQVSLLDPMPAWLRGKVKRKESILVSLDANCLWFWSRWASWYLQGCFKTVLQWNDGGHALILGILRGCWYQTGGRPCPSVPHRLLSGPSLSLSTNICVLQWPASAGVRFPAERALFNILYPAWSRSPPCPTLVSSDPLVSPEPDSNCGLLSGL